MKKILMVEDNECIATIVKKYLERAGYACDVAPTVIEGLMRIAHYDYSAVILDYVFECFTGKDIEDLTNKRKIPTVFFTAASKNNMKNIKSPVIFKYMGHEALLNVVNELTKNSPDISCEECTLTDMIDCSKCPSFSKKMNT
jgi:CheY-like chemotaxis protein